MIPQNHNLDMTPSGVPIVVNASQYDVGREINFYLYNGSEVYTPAAGALIRVEGTKPDGTGFSYSATNIGNKVTVSLTEQMTVLEGEIKCELRVTEGGSDVGSLNFTLLVEKAALKSDIPISDTDIPAIIELARAEQYNAEAWAVGQKNGQDVPVTDPTYHNNAKYWSENAQHGSLDALADVTITTPSNGQALLYDANSDEWKNGNVVKKLNDMSDAAISAPTNGQLLSYDNAASKWKNKSVGIDDLKDATITSATDGQLLQYDSANQIWKNSSDIPTSVSNVKSTMTQNGAHNLGVNNGVGQTIQNVVFTVNADKSVTLSGGTVPSGQSAQFVMCDRNKKECLLRAGTYTLSGGADGNTNSLFIGIGTGNTGDGSTGSWVFLGDTRNGETTFTLSSDKYIAWYVMADSNSSYTTPKTVYPMITAVEDTDTTYTPYAMTNRELTEVYETSVTNNGLTAYFYRNGKVVYATVTGSITNAVSSGDALFTIPTGYVPVRDVNVLFANPSSLTDSRSVLDTTDSKWKAYASISSGASVRVSCTYICK